MNLGEQGGEALVDENSTEVDSNFDPAISQFLSFPAPALPAAGEGSESRVRVEVQVPHALVVCASITITV